MFSQTLGRCCNGARRELFFIFRSSYSTTAAETAPVTSTFFSEFLTDSLGFSQKESISIAAKVPNFSSRAKPMLVVEVLKKIGLDSSQIRKCISKYPQLLYFHVDKNLNPKLECLQELGFSSSDLGEIVVKGANIFGRGLDTNIRPNLASLSLLFGKSEDLRKAIKSYPWLLDNNQVLLEKVSYFQKIGFSDEKIRWFIAHRPKPFCYPLKWFEERVDILENDYGILRGSSMFFYGIYATCTLSKQSMDNKCAIFRSFGWCDSDIVTMFQTQPSYFTLSEANIRKKLDYFMNKLGCKPDFMSTRPLLTYSLEKRVMPRIEVINALKEKNLNMKFCSIYSIITCTEHDFERKILLPYKDAVPGVFESYKKRVGR